MLGEWWKLQYTPQPYEQLAKVLKKQGHEKGVADVLIAKEDDRRKYINMPPLVRVGSWILGFTIGYGYESERALKIGFVLVLIGWWLFSSGVIVRVDSSDSEEINVLPRYNSFIYSLDTFLPIVNLYQLKYFLPDSTKKCLLFKCGRFKLFVCGLVVYYYFWIQIILGWILTTFYIGALTGLIRK